MERSVVIAGVLKHRTWLIEPSQPFAERVGKQIMLNLRQLPTSVRRIDKLPTMPISYQCFNSRGHPLDRHGFPSDPEPKNAFQAEARKFRSKKKAVSREWALSRVDDFVAFMQLWDFIVDEGEIAAIRESIASADEDALGDVVAEGFREVLKRLKDRRWG